MSTSNNSGNRGRGQGRGSSRGSSGTRNNIPRSSRQTPAQKRETKVVQKAAQRNDQQKLANQTRASFVHQSPQNPRNNPR